MEVLAPADLFPIEPQDFIAGLQRGLALIEAFSADQQRLSVAEAAARTGIPRSATRRHLLTLCHLDYLKTDGKLFWLGPRVMRLGHGYLSLSRLPRLVQPTLQRLAEQLGETVNVSVLDGHDVAYVARSTSPRMVPIGFEPGDRAPAHAVAPGVVLVGALGEASAEHWIQAHPFVRFTADTVALGQDFAAEVQAARRQGYCLLERQLNPGLKGLALPLTDLRGTCHGAMGTTFPASARSDRAVEETLLPAMRAAVDVLRPLL